MTSTIKVNNIQNQCGQNIINENSNTITIGASGDTIALASGASQTGFGRTGAVDWQTTPKTTTFTAVSGEGYFVDTSSGAVTANLPAGSAGAIVSFADYAKTFDTSALTLSPNGSDKIRGVAGGASLTTEGQGTTIIFVDSTQGWIDVIDSTASLTGNDNLVASGGTVTTSGDYKIHSFTGPGTFTVSQVSQTAADNVVSYLVVAGGGGAGGASWVGGAGAGGFREFRGTNSGCYAVSPLNGSTPITVTAQGYPITVGAGGAGGSGSPGPTNGVVGNVSTFSSVSSAGGAYSDKYSGGDPAPSGGSGAGATANNNTGGAGNTPPVSPPQGQNGGDSTGNGGGGGGGAGAAGTPRATGGGGGGPAPCSVSVAGAAGVATSITASPVTYSAGGRGIGGSPGGFSPSPNSGTANTGNGGSGATTGSSPNPGGTGGSGIVVIRYKYQ